MSISRKIEETAWLVGPGRQGDRLPGHESGQYPGPGQYFLLIKEEWEKKVRIPAIQKKDLWIRFFLKISALPRVSERN